MKLLSIFLISIFSHQTYATSPQSEIQNQVFKNEVKTLKTKDDWTSLHKLWQWRTLKFKGAPGGGKLVGKRSIDELFTTRTLSGCHEDGLLFVSALRELGFKATLLETLGIQWAIDFNAKKKTCPMRDTFLLKQR